jgi:polyisoprenoid-binding protein YceI
MKLLFATSSAAGLAALLASVSPRVAPSSAPAAGSYQVDNVHSAVIFHTRHVGISEAYGRFNRISDKSEVVVDADPAKCSILLVVEAESVDTGVPDRDKHLRSGDFFNAREFPEIVFESKEITGSEKGWEVTGELSFHGVTKTVTAKARQVGKGEFQGEHRIGLVAEFSIDMRDFALDMLKKNPGAVGPEVALTVSLECARK